MYPIDPVSLIAGLVLGIVLGALGLIAVVRAFDALEGNLPASPDQQTLQRMVAAAERTGADVDAMADEVGDTLARCRAMHPGAYDPRRNRRAGDRAEGGAP